MDAEVLELVLFGSKLDLSFKAVAPGQDWTELMILRY